MSTDPRLPFPIGVEPTPRQRQTRLLYSGRPAVARHSSYEAARRAQATAPAQRRVLLRYLTARGLEGATDAETERDLGWRPNIITARRNDLIDDGVVVALTQRRPTIRPTAVGKTPLRVVAWVTVEALRA